MAFYIAGFPGIGKTYLKNNSQFFIQDSDSSLFSKNEDGSPNPNFIRDYFDHLETFKEDEGQVVLISTHEDVLKELKARGFKHTIVIPEQSSKHIYLERYKHRGSPQAFIDLIDKNWDAWLADIKHRYRNVYELEADETLSDYIAATYEQF